jgi:hypothetical protein
MKPGQARSSGTSSQQMKCMWWYKMARRQKLGGLQFNPALGKTRKPYPKNN